MVPLFDICRRVWHAGQMGGAASGARARPSPACDGKVQRNIRSVYSAQARVCVRVRVRVFATKPVKTCQAPHRRGALRQPPTPPHTPRAYFG